MAIPTIAEFEAAKVDLDDLEAILNGDSSTTVETRLGASIPTLSKAVADYGDPFRVDDFAAARAFNHADFTEGKNLFINFKTTFGDKLGGRFAWVSASTSADDDLNVLQLTSNGSNPGRLERVSAETFNLGKSSSKDTTIDTKLRFTADLVADYGADPTGTVDNTAAIGACRTDMSTNGEVSVPAGFYKVDSGVALATSGSKGIKWKGVGPSTSVFRFDGTSGTPFSFVSCSDIHFEDIGFYYSSGSFSGTLFDMNNNARCSFTRCWFHGGATELVSQTSAAYLIDLENNITTLFTRCRFSGGIYLIRGRDPSGGVGSTSMSFVNCDYDSYVSAAFHNVDQGWTIHGGAMENRSDGGGAAILNDVGRPCFGVSYKGVWHGDASLSSAWSWITINGNGIEIGGNYFNGIGGAAPNVCSINDTTKGLVIEGNFCSSFAAVVAAGSSLLSDSRIGPNALSSVTNQVTGTLGANVTTKDNSEIEEGIFTPDLRVNGVATGITYTTQSGRYVRVGNKVDFTIAITLSSKGGNSGAVRIYGLPFTSSSDGGQSFSVGNWSNLASGLTIGARVEPSNTIITLNKDGGITKADLQDTDISNTTALGISGTYFIA